jgi:hypothetical protein
MVATGYLCCRDLGFRREDEAEKRRKGTGKSSDPSLERVDEAQGVTYLPSANQKQQPSVMSMAAWSSGERESMGGRGEREKETPPPLSLRPAGHPAASSGGGEVGGEWLVGRRVTPIFPRKPSL